MPGLLQTGIAGRIRAQLAEWNLTGSRSAAEERALAAARQLDSDEVGRRADRMRVEREAAADQVASSDADQPAPP